MKKKEPHENQNEETYRKVIETNLKQVTEKVIGYKKQEARKPWMTKEILDEMEKRRLAKTKDDKEQYNRIHRGIRNKIKQAKEKWLTEQCQEAESLHELHDSFNFHKKLKEISGCYKKRNISSVRRNNKIITNNEELRQTWEEYIKALYQDDRPIMPNINNEQGPTGPSILLSEVRYTANPSV